MDWKCGEIQATAVDSVTVQQSVFGTEAASVDAILQNSSSFHQTRRLETVSLDASNTHGYQNIFDYFSSFLINNSTASNVMRDRL